MKGRINKKDFTERMALPRVGQIKIGKKNEKGYPMSLDYFVPSGKYASLFTQVYGEKPNSIQIVFMDDDLEKVCNEQYQYRDDEGKLIAFGDGEEFMVYNGKEYAMFNITDYPDIMERIAQKHPNRQVKRGEDGWKIVLTLTFVIPMVRGIAGVWQFQTCGSASTIPNIAGTFDAVMEQKGHCKGVIFDLNVQFAKSQKPGQTSRYPVVSLVPNESRENLMKIKKASEPIQLTE